MIELRFERRIRADAERAFGLLADLRDYDRWLPPSAAFHGTTRISGGPIGVGTTYVEQSSAGVRHGRVTALVRPTRLDFEQPMTLRPAILGEIGIKLFHTLDHQEVQSVHLLRRLELTPRGPVTWFMPLAVRAFRAENERMMTLLAAFAEGAAR